ncbi:MAG: hypothetical protein FJZ96_08145 [Chloroflexi bacterium]|nr:hypothetical protein [Chloroflexota bacterium]
MLQKITRLALPLLAWALAAAACAPQSGPAAQPSPTAPTLPDGSQPASLPPEGQATAEAGTAVLPAELDLDPEDWRNWPVLPVITSRVAETYRLGRELGNNPQAFSVFGDCQSKPEVFMGVYETDPQVFAALPPDLQETVVYFHGSFNRESPTVRDATTAGGLLWPEWHQGTYGCRADETPVDCELRIHKPSFVFINVGTHWVERNQQYLRTIIQQLLGSGVAPILVSKADDRLQGELTNLDLAILAVEFDIPFWNFWAEALALPEHGLYTKPDQAGLGDVYLTDEAIQLYRLSALQALDSVWRAAIQP